MMGKNGTPKAFHIVAQGKARSATPWETETTHEGLLICFPGRCPGLLHFTPLA